MTKNVFVKVDNKWVTRDLRVLGIVYLGAKKEREAYHTLEAAEQFCKEYNEKNTNHKVLEIVIEYTK